MGHIETHIIQLTYSHVNLGHSKFHGAHWHTLNADPGGQFRKAYVSPGNRQGILFAHKEWELGIAMFDHFQHYFILSKTSLSFCVLRSFFCCTFLSIANLPMLSLLLLWMHVKNLKSIKLFKLLKMTHLVFFIARSYLFVFFFFFFALLLFLFDCLVCLVVWFGLLSLFSISSSFGCVVVDSCFLVDIGLFVN